MNPRALLVLPLAVAAAVLAIRSAAAEAPAGHPLHRLHALWPGHPASATERAMTAIGAAARTGQGMPPAATAALAGVARRAPLAPEPFLAAGAEAQLAGDERRAERLFVAARDRDPRAQAARFFLADRYLRTGRIDEGLIEMAILARLAPRAAQPFAGSVAAYARSPGAVPHLRQLFRVHPDTRDNILDALAFDARNAGLVLTLAPSLPLRSAALPSWPARLMEAMIAAGDIGGAERVWEVVFGVERSGLINNSRFVPGGPPPPFNWAAMPTAAGTAELGASGLSVAYYGREEALLARQLLRLAPGRYRVSATAAGDPGDIRWALSCVADARVVASVPVSGGIVDMPEACAGPWLQLVARPGEVERAVDLTVREIRIEPERRP